MTKLTEKRP